MPLHLCMMALDRSTLHASPNVDAADAVTPTSIKIGSAFCGLKDPNDTKWSDSPGMRDYRKFFDKYRFGPHLRTSIT